MTATVSVVIPCYNGARFLGEALESVRTQSRRPDELVLVDDCSTDTSLLIAEQFAATADFPVRIVRRETNSGGPARPINDGIGRATGELIAVLDQDDVFEPHKIECEARALETTRSARLAFSLCSRLGPDDSRESFVRRTCLETLVGEGASTHQGTVLLATLMRHANVLVGFPGFTFRRADFLDLGGLDESLAIAADYELLCRLATSGDVVFTGEFGYRRRLHGGNVASRNIVSRLDVLRVVSRYTVHADASVSSAAWIALRQRTVELASCLAAGGYWRSAERVLAGHRRIDGRSRFVFGFGRATLYWTYCRLAGKPWHISSADAARAVATVEGLPCTDSELVRGTG